MVRMANQTAPTGRMGAPQNPYFTPSRYGRVSTESAFPAVAAAAIFALLGGPISVAHLGWDPAAAGDLITAFACPFTNVGALLAVN